MKDLARRLRSAADGIDELGHEYFHFGNITAIKIMIGRKIMNTIIDNAILIR